MTILTRANEKVLHDLITLAGGFGLVKQVLEELSGQDPDLSQVVDRIVELRKEQEEPETTSVHGPAEMEPVP